MINITYLQPFAIDLNIGREYNRACEMVPADDWICIVDQDVMFLRPDTKLQIHEVVSRFGDQYGVLGCKTNRVGRMLQVHGGNISEDMDVRNHYEIATELHNTKYCEVTTVNMPVAGMLMLFKKSTWEKVKFVENTFRFDTIFCQQVMQHGGRIGIMEGVYIFHLYRIWSNRPKEAIEHLKK